MSKPFQGFNHGKGKIVLKTPSCPIEMRPTEIHLKEDGDILHQPSLCIVMRNEQHRPEFVVGQISLAMLNDGLKDIGYEVKKIEPVTGQYKAEAT